jgi:hypothetical protein
MRYHNTNGIRNKYSISISTLVLFPQSNYADINLISSLLAIKNFDEEFGAF